MDVARALVSRSIDNEGSMEICCINSCEKLLYIGVYFIVCDVAKIPIKIPYG